MEQNGVQERRLTLAKLRAVLPADGSSMTIEEIAQAFGVLPESAKMAIKMAIEEATGVVLLRGGGRGRSHVLAARRLERVGEPFTEPMRADLLPIEGRPADVPAPVVERRPPRPRPAAEESPSPAEAPPEEFAETF